MRQQHILATLLVFLTCHCAFAADIPLSVAERSNYTRTATEAELDEILAATANASPQIARWTLGTSNEGRAIQALQIGFDSIATENPLTVVVIGGIHSGECAGKEAMCDLAREIAQGMHQQWLGPLRLIIVPSLSPDSNSRRAIDNRPGQIGPSDGMGTRANAQGLDLNRDFIKLETPEIQSLVAAIRSFDADVLIDLHTTNGSQHRYDLTYDPPHHPLTPDSIRILMREQLLPAVTQRAAERGVSLFYYGNFDRSHSRWITYGYEGRYSTNYMGLRGKIGILSEAYSYATYPRRIEASKVFVSDILDYFTTNADQIRKTLSTVSPPAINAEIGLAATLQAFDEPVMIRGYLPDPQEANVERVDHDYQVDFYGNFVANVKQRLPMGYYIPDASEAVINLLDRHGVAYERGTLNDKLSYEAFTISQCNVDKQVFQGHNIVSLEGTWQKIDTPNSTESSLWINCNQPQAPLAAVLLQPESVDSIASWNLIKPESLQPQMLYPVLRAFEPKD